MKPCEDCQKLHGSSAQRAPALHHVPADASFSHELQTIAHYNCTMCDTMLVREMGETWRVLEH